jgi:hypothetical protein
MHFATALEITPPSKPLTPHFIPSWYIENNV